MVLFLTQNFDSVLIDVQNRIETSASWSSIQYNLLEVEHIEK